MAEDSVVELTQKLREFSQARDWQQFQTPKNLSMALIVEAAELVEHFQWLTAEQSEQLGDEKLAEVGYEMADILMYLLRMADGLNIDVLQAAREKMLRNEQRYPADKVRGSARKYSDYKSE